MSHNIESKEPKRSEPAERNLVETSPATSTEVKDIEMMDSDHPQVKALGSQAIETQTKNGLGEFLSDFIYESDWAFYREYLQNSETACLRACKFLIRNHPDYGEEWLTKKIWVDKKTGETVREYTEQDAEQARLPDDNLPANPGDLVNDEHDDWRVIEIPRPLEEVVNAARNIGYDPTITIDVHHDEQKIVWEDNGIGMTLYEFKSAFMDNFSSGSALEEDMGGKFGVGAKASALPHGKDGGMLGYSVTRRDDVPDYSKEGVSFYSYLGGANLRPNNEIPDDFRGTHFEIPVTEEFDLDDAKNAVERYTELLRVPVLYREHKNGQNEINEEYGEVSFEEYHDNPPVVIDRPGEFTAVDGPDVAGYKQPDTWLVSMRIDRNAEANVSSFYNTAIQIHDEQGRIVSGPNRGRYADGNKVYETRKCEHLVGNLHDDDVPLPQPVGSRDNFQSDDHNERFFKYLSDEIAKAELGTVSETANKMTEADHPADVLGDDELEWKLLHKMVSYHGPYNVFSSERQFKKFIKNRDEFPTFGKKTRKGFMELFNKVGHAGKRSRQPNNKRGRSERMIGQILVNCDREKVFMACGINKEKHKVVYNTYPKDGAVIKIDGRNKYDEYEDAFGFKRLKEVPRTQDKAHRFDVPDDIHEANQSTNTSNTTSKPDSVEERTLKLRTDSKTKKIDKRYTIKRCLKLLDGRGPHIGSYNRLIVFPRSADESVTDHTGMQKFGAIASVTNDELDAIIDHPNVFTYEQYVEQAENTVLATDAGPIKAKNLRQKERFTIVLYATAEKHKKILKDTDTKQRLRQLIKKDREKDHYSWRPDDMDDPEVVLAVADKKTLEKAQYALYKQSVGKGELQGLKLRRQSPGTNTSMNFQRLRNLKDYRRKAKTPDWDNDSTVYSLFGESEQMDAVLFGFHDAGINPQEQDPEDLRSWVSTPDLFAASDGDDN